LRTLAGRTLVEWATTAARSSSLVTRVVGTTDDDEIARTFERAGTEVVRRPPSLAGDDVPDAPVFLHVLEALPGYAPEIVVNVRPTAPLRTGVDIDAALDILLSDDRARSVKSVSPVSEHPYKMWTLQAQSHLEPLLPAWQATNGGDPDAPRQSLPAVYRSNGAVDAVRVEALLASRRFHPGPVAAYVMAAERAIDIDDENDLRVAEALLRGAA
jgi:CMP-N-acetylneuraminic acid synthetase